MIRAGVVGSPIGHSLSPVIHRAWLRAARIDGRYDAYGPDGSVEEFIRARSAELSGLNVTIPFKLDALALATEATVRATAAGAANLLVFGRNGSILADNTDGEGLLAALTEQTPGFDPAAGPVTNPRRGRRRAGRGGCVHRRRRSRSANHQSIERQCSVVVRRFGRSCCGVRPS